MTMPDDALCRPLQLGKCCKHRALHSSARSHTLELKPGWSISGIRHRPLLDLSSGKCPSVELCLAPSEVFLVSLSSVTPAYHGYLRFSSMLQQKLSTTLLSKVMFFTLHANTLQHSVLCKSAILTYFDWWKGIMRQELQSRLRVPT